MALKLYFHPQLFGWLLTIVFALRTRDKLAHRRWEPSRWRSG